MKAQDNQERGNFLFLTQPKSLFKRVGDVQKAKNCLAKCRTEHHNMRDRAKFPYFSSIFVCFLKYLYRNREILKMT